MAGWLAQAALDRGLTVFLMAAGPDEARIYARAGFVEHGEVLHISLRTTATRA
jgi:predicted GNAT family acetyltransferase